MGVDFRKDTVNLVFSGVEEILECFQENYSGIGQLIRIPCRHPYSSVVQIADRKVTGTKIYLVETKDTPTGKLFRTQPHAIIKNIVESYDTVLQLTLGSLESEIRSYGTVLHKVNGTILSEFPSCHKDFMHNKM